MSCSQAWRVRHVKTTSPQETFCQCVIASANVHHDKIAMTLIEPNSRETVTYGSMLAQVRSIAYRLIQENIGFGERVALIGENHPNWAIAYLGIIYRGAVVTPLDPAATIQALASFLKNSEAKLAFVSPTSLNKFRSACELSGINISTVALRPIAQRNGLGDFTDWSQTPVPKSFIETPPPAKPEDLALLMYTSGTTGIPKAVPLAGFRVSTADSTADALHLAASEHFDALLLDYWMPDLTGIELCRRIRTFDQNTPILICSGAVTPADKEAAVLAGAQGYVNKPFYSGDLIRALRSSLKAKIPEQNLA